MLAHVCKSNPTMLAHACKPRCCQPTAPRNTATESSHLPSDLTPAPAMCRRRTKQRWKSPLSRRGEEGARSQVSVYRQPRSEISMYKSVNGHKDTMRRFVSLSLVQFGIRNLRRSPSRARALSLARARFQCKQTYSLILTCTRMHRYFREKNEV